MTNHQVTGGPAVVAIGGGHGLAAALRAIRLYTEQVVAVVSVADDGGSSGRLRHLYGMPAPGDIRRCLLALADPDSQLAEALALRFSEGELGGHVAGNLLLAALTQTTGDFVGAIDEVGRLLEISGSVWPSASGPVTLVAQTAQGVVTGQVAIKEAGSIWSVALAESEAACPPQVLAAVAAADQIVLGPGSLFTSVLAATAVPALREALRQARAERVYLCNLRPEAAETEGFSVAQHLEVLQSHGVTIDRVLCDPANITLGEVGIPVTEAALAVGDTQIHDSGRLAAALSALVFDPT